MTTATQELTTEQVLVDMLTENTGTHMLDSGGAYGRNWERNGGKTLEDFKAAPAITVETWEHDGSTVVEYVTLDLFHFLADRVEYDAELDEQLHAFGTSEEMADESWFTCLEGWLESISAKWEGQSCLTINTYNGEDSLSQIIQYALFEHPETGQATAAIMIHGGCDARGGYTAPRVFTVDDYSLCDNDRYTAVLTEPTATAAELAQEVIFAEHPVPVGGRQVTVDFSGYADRNCEPWDDKSLDVIDFKFGETPVRITSDGSYVVTEGPAKGWSLDFHEWPAG